MSKINQNESIEFIDNWLKQQGINKAVSSAQIKSVFEKCQKNEDGTVDMDVFALAVANEYSDNPVDQLGNEFLDAWEDFAGKDGNSKSVSTEDLSVLDDSSANSVSNTNASSGMQSSPSGGQMNTSTPSVQPANITGSESLEELESSRKDTLQQLSEAQRNKDNNEAVNAAKEHVETAKAAYDEAVEQLESEDEEIQAQIDDIKQRKSDNDKAIDEKKNEIDTIKNDISSTESEISSLQGELNSISTNQSDYQTTDPETGETTTDTAAYQAALQQRAIIEQKIKDAEDKLTKLQNDLTAAEGELSDLEAQGSEIDTELNNLLQEQGDKINNSEVVQQALEAYTEAQQNLTEVEQAETAQIDANISQLRENLNAYDSALQEKRAEELAATEQQSAISEEDRNALIEELNLPADATDEQILDAQMNKTSAESLQQIAAMYTDKEPLTDDDYAHIIALYQADMLNNGMLARYSEQMDEEGWIDAIYNGLKDVFGGITPEMLKSELEGAANCSNALQAIINDDTETAQQLQYDELVRRMKTDPENASKYLINYCGSEEKALEILNKYLANPYDKENVDENYTYKAAYKDGEFYIQLYDSDGKLYHEESWTNEINSHSFHPYTIVNYTEELKEIAPKDFDSAWKFMYGTDYSAEKMERYVNSVIPYSDANMALATAYNYDDRLAHASNPNDAYNVFLEAANGDKEKAIEYFNDYYQQFLASNTNGLTLLNNETLQSITARQNPDSGEIEFVYRVKGDADRMYELFGEDMSTEGKYDDYFSDCLDENGENYYEFVYNPALMQQLDETDDTRYSDAYSWIMQPLVRNNMFASADGNGIKYFHKKYTEEYRAEYGKTPEEAVEEYNEAYKEIFGEDNKFNKLFNDYKSDMDSYSKKVSMVLSIGGMAASFVCPAFGYVAMAGVFADNIIDGTNMATNHKYGEDWRGLVKDTILEGGIMLAGMGINKIAQGAHSIFSSYLGSKGLSVAASEVFGTTLEVGVDATLSCGFDYVTTGDLNFQGNSMGILIDIFSGIRGYKAIKANRAARAAAETAADAAARSSADEFSGFRWDLWDQTKLGQDYNARANVDADVDVPRLGSGYDAANIANARKVSDALWGRNRANVGEYEGACAVESTLGAIQDKPMLQQALEQNVTYNPRTDTYSFDAFGEHHVVKLQPGESLIDKYYDAYHMVYGNNASDGDFVTRVFSDLMGSDSSPIVVKPTTDNIDVVRRYAGDDNTILTFNTTASDIPGVSPDHAYILKGVDAQGRITIEDPVTGKRITLEESDYSRGQISGKTYADEGYLDGTAEARVWGEHDDMSISRTGSRLDAADALDVSMSTKPNSPAITPQQKENFISAMQKFGATEAEARQLFDFMEKECVIVDGKRQVEITQKQIGQIIKAADGNAESIYLLAPRQGDDIKSYTNATRDMLEIADGLLPAENARLKIDFDSAFTGGTQKITIVLADDCSISGSSMVTDIISNMEGSIRAGQSANVLFAPTVMSDQASFRLQQFSTLFEECVKFGGVTDNMRAFISTEIVDSTKTGVIKEMEARIENLAKQEGRISFSLAEGIPATDYKHTQTYSALNAEGKATVDLWLTARGNADGYKHGGTMIAITGYEGDSNAFLRIAPDSEAGKALGIGLELPQKGNAPNNNAYATQVLAREIGVDPSRIKQSGVIAPEDAYRAASEGMEPGIVMKWDTRNEQYTGKIEFIFEDSSGKEHKVRLKRNPTDQQGTTKFSPGQKIEIGYNIVDPNNPEVIMQAEPIIITIPAKQSDVDSTILAMRKFSTDYPTKRGNYFGFENGVSNSKMGQNSMVITVSSDMISDSLYFNLIQ